MGELKISLVDFASILTKIIKEEGKSVLFSTGESGVRCVIEDFSSAKEWQGNGVDPISAFTVAFNQIK